MTGKDISIINKALSNKNGESEFIIKDKGENLGMSSMVWGETKDNTKKQLVKTIRVDDDSKLRYLSPKTIKIDAPIMKIQGAYVWMDRNWPVKFFDWMKEEKLDTKLSGMTQMNNKLKLEFIDGKSITLFGLKYDKQKIF